MSQEGMVTSQAGEGSPVSYKVEVIADASGVWAGNGLRFASEADADRYACDLFARWTLVQETRIVPSGDAVNARWHEGAVRYQSHED